jgi:hypothetical protein
MRDVQRRARRHAGGDHQGDPLRRVHPDQRRVNNRLVRGPRRIYALAAFAFGGVRPALATPAFALGASPPPAESRAARRPSPGKAVNFEVIHCGKSETFKGFSLRGSLKFRVPLSISFEHDCPRNIPTFTICYRDDPRRERERGSRQAGTREALKGCRFTPG